MEPIIEQTLKDFFAYKNAKFILPKYKEELINWIVENYHDDYFNGGLAEVAMTAMHKLFICKSDESLLSVYNYLINSANTNYWGSSILDEVFTLIAKCSKNGEKLFAIRFPKLKDNQLAFYNRIISEHSEFYSDVKEK